VGRENDCKNNQFLYNFGIILRSNIETEIEDPYDQQYNLNKIESKTMDGSR